MKIKHRIKLGFGSIILVLTLVLGLFEFSSYYIVNVSSTTLNYNLDLVELAYQMHIHVLTLRRFEKDLFLNTNSKEKQSEYKNKWDKEYNTLNKKITSLVDTLKKNLQSKDLEQILLAEELLNNYHQGLELVYLGIQNNQIKDPVSGNQFINQYKMYIHKMETIFSAFYIERSKILNVENQKTNNNFLLVRKAIPFFALFAILFSFGLSYIISKSIIQPIEKITSNLIEISEGEGDLTANVNIQSKDEIGVLSKHFNQFVSKIRSIIIDIKNISSKINAGSTEIDNSANLLKDNMTDLFNSSEVISMSIEEVSSNVGLISDSSKNLTKSVSVLFEKASKLLENINLMKKNIQEVQITFKGISQNAALGDESIKIMNANIKNITESSDKMLGILGIINGISKQVNLLALNASIEAARAGESGRGFAIVAEEISKLAAQTTHSVKDIGNIIQNNSIEIEDGMRVSNNTLKIISDMVRDTNNIYQTMTTFFNNTEIQIRLSSELENEVGIIHDSTYQIEAAIEEQKKAFRDISDSIITVNNLTKANATSSESLNSLSKQFSELAYQMQNKIAIFKTEN